jgi:DNA-binding NarL/FixJ family response regulator
MDVTVFICTENACYKQRFCLKPHWQVNAQNISDYLQKHKPSLYSLLQQATVLVYCFGKQKYKRTVVSKSPAELEFEALCSALNIDRLTQNILKLKRLGLTDKEICNTLNCSKQKLEARIKALMRLLNEKSKRSLMFKLGMYNF